MDEKISIILPIFNVGVHLRRGIDSLINQTIGNENLEIIMVNDCSTDGSDKIIDEYAKKYDCCIAIHHEKNSGAAYTPRNTGIDACTGDYIMFLDPDDTYSLDACEKLYDAVKKYGADIAFGRYKRIFTYEGKIQKSYSPYKDNIEEIYHNVNFDKIKPSKISNFIHQNIISHFLYGKKLKSNYSLNQHVDLVYAKHINDEPNLLKIAPSVWSRIYKRELIVDNHIYFQPYISGDDMAFSLETLLNSNGIVFLNDLLVYNYYIRDLPDDKSITNNVNVKLLDELMESYTYCRRCTEDFSNDIKTASINPHLFHWFNLWRRANFTEDENELLVDKVHTLRKIHNNDLKSRLLLYSIERCIKFKS